MKILKNIFVFAFFFMALDHSFASDQEALLLISQRLATNGKNLKIESVRFLSNLNMYEVVNGKRVIYVDKSIEHVFTGRIVEIDSRIDLTQQKIDELYKSGIGQFPIQDSVIFVKGSGERKLFVFADPNCRYCQLSDREIAKLDDVTIYVFLLGMLSDESKKMARNIWCSKNSALAWKKWMTTRSKASSASIGCDSPEARNLLLARSWGVTATPTFFFSDGKKHVGYLSAESAEDSLITARGTNQKSLEAPQREQMHRDN